MEWLNQYIGVPYRSRGRSFRGADCFGIMALIYQHELGIKIPEFNYTSAKDVRGNAPIISREKRCWNQVSESEISAFDVVLFNITGVEAHIGVLVDSTKKLVIHTLAEHDSALIRLDSAQWNRRVAGFYRHNDFFQTAFFQARSS